MLDVTELRNSYASTCCNQRVAPFVWTISLRRQIPAKGAQSCRSAQQLFPDRKRHDETDVEDASIKSQRDDLNFPHNGRNGRDRCMVVSC